MSRPTSLPSGRPRWFGTVTLLNVGLLLVMLGLSACEPEPDAPALRGAASDERHAATPVSGATSGTRDSTARHSACTGWAFVQACDSAISSLIEFFSDSTYDWSRFSRNPEKLRDLQEERNEGMLRRLSIEYVGEVSGLFELSMAAFDQLVAAGLYGIRMDIYLDTVEPISEAGWSPTAAHVRADTRSEVKLLNGSILCLSETLRITMRREGSDEPWLFDRGFLFPLNKDARVGPCE